MPRSNPKSVRRFGWGPLAALLLLTACVPRAQYESMEVEKNYYQGLVERNDSLQAAQSVSTYSNQATQRREIDQYVRQLENLTATNLSLNRSFQDLQNRYQTLLAQNNELLSSSGQRVNTLEADLAQRQAELNRREQDLRQAEIALRNREAQINQIAGQNASDPTAYEPATYGNQVQPPNANQALAQNQLQSEIAQITAAYPDQNFYTSQLGTEGLRLTIAEVQLFSDGFTLNNSGKQFLAQLANLLTRYPDAELTVVGHEDPSLAPLTAFENSTDRAIAIVNFLRSNGLFNMDLVAGGKGGTDPRVDSSTAANQQINRRTDILIRL